jgi:hypothetical protein
MPFFVEDWIERAQCPFAIEYFRSERIISLRDKKEIFRVFRE